MIRRPPPPQSTASEFSLNSNELWGYVDPSASEEDLPAHRRLGHVHTLWAWSSKGVYVDLDDCESSRASQARPSLQSRITV
jgi:hypothetical protein